MLKSLTDVTEMRDYISDLSSLINLVNDSSTQNHNPGLKYLNDYTSLLLFKINNDLIQELRIDLSSGIISFGHISKLMAEKDNLRLKLKSSFTSKEIRNKLIKELDSQDTIQSSQKDEFDLSKTIDTLAKRYYLSLLKKADITQQVSVNASLIESGESDLIKITSAGYCLPLSAICSSEIDLYVHKKKADKRKVKINSHAEVSLSDSLREQIIGFLGIPSNMVYEFIRKEKGLEPRRVERTVFAPFYSKFFNPRDKTAERVDPHYLKVYQSLSENPMSVLSIHTDTSTEHFDPFREVDDDSTEKPNITIEPRYYCLDQETARQLKKCVPKEYIITPKSIK